MNAGEFELRVLLRIQVFGSGIGDDIDDVNGDVTLRSHSCRRVLLLAWYYITTFLTGVTKVG
jgi:hypothetical protein